jgi:hypothetical protein
MSDYLLRKEQLLLAKIKKAEKKGNPKRLTRLMEHYTFINNEITRTHAGIQSTI